MLSLLTCLLLSPSAQAVPLQITQQGRMIDTSGAAVDGSQIVVFRVYDAETGGNQLWEEYLTVQFNNGYYATVLGVDESGNPLDSETLSLYPIFLEIQLNSNPPMSPRQSINSAPYAQIAGVAESVEGGTVNASEVQIGSSPVIDGNRNWVGEPITVDWSSIQNVPSELQDGDNDTQLSESEVENYVTNGGLSLHEDTTLNGQEILTLGNDSDTLANISCSDGDVPKWDGVVGQWDCGFDNDTLADLNCAAGELAKFDGTNWSCGEDIDTVLDADTVISYVEQNSLSIPAGSQIDGADILTSADTLEPEWTDIQNRPNGLDDGDDDTQLSQSEVVGYVESGSVNLASGSQVNSRNIVGQPSVCTGGQVLVYNASSNDWECGDDTDTTLTESEMQTMIEAMTLNFQNRPQVSGADVLTTDSTIDPTKIDVSGSTEGQMLVSDGSTVNWQDGSNSDCTEDTHTHLDGSIYVSVKCDKYNYVIKKGGISNFWSNNLSCETSFLEYSSGGVISFIDCGSSTYVLNNESTSSLLSTSLFSLSEGFCSLDSNGVITCWGNNQYDQITNTPTNTFTDIFTGGYHICGIDNSTEIECWGRDGDGQVSDAPSGSFSRISLGWYHSCGIRTNGEIQCWGANNKGQTSSPNGTFVSISSGENHSCAISTEGVIKCWGDNNFGQSTNKSGIFEYIFSKGSNNCALDEQGYVTCWGNDDYGQVSNTPPDSFEHLSMGTTHTCGLTQDQNIKCWGQDEYGQVSNIPDGTFSKVVTRSYSNCALTTYGEIKCWGQDSQGQVSNVPSGTFIDISLSDSASCGVLNSGNIVCWGNSSWEQLSPP